MPVFSISPVFFERFEVRVTVLFMFISTKTPSVNFCPQMLLGFGKPAVVSRGQSNGLVGSQTILCKRKQSFRDVL